MTMLVSEGSGALLIAGVLVIAVIYVALLVAEKSWSKRAGIPPDCCFPFIREYGYEFRASSINGSLCRKPQEKVL
ncbi:hypothetical protein SUGI_0304920 [Cryptomeria japonica]|nr:hypothetical protein SUGI_0304920 [Cryptomeria japonica]